MGVAEPGAHAADGVGRVTVNYWAAARAAAGVASDVVEVAGQTTLADVLEVVLARRADRPRLAGVVATCSVLVGDRPVTELEPDRVLLSPGETVELLPPFAGG